MAAIKSQGTSVLDRLNWLYAQKPPCGVARDRGSKTELVEPLAKHARIVNNRLAAVNDRASNWNAGDCGFDPRATRE
jgi:hypothetical protein